MYLDYLIVTKGLVGWLVDSRPYIPHVREREEGENEIQIHFITCAIPLYTWSGTKAPIHGAWCKVSTERHMSTALR